MRRQELAAESQDIDALLRIILRVLATELE
jgi:hypothetical protein